MELKGRAQETTATAWARRSAGRMMVAIGSCGVTLRSGGRGPGSPKREWAGGRGVVRRNASLAGAGSRGVSGGATLGAKARNSGLVRNRRGAVILQERLLCSSVTNRRSAAASYALVFALELKSGFSAA